MEEPKKYYINDIESGIPYEVSREEYEAYHSMMASVRPTIKNPCIGQVVIFGTGGEMESKVDFEKFWQKEEELCKSSIGYFASNYIVDEKGNKIPWTERQIEELETLEKLRKESKPILRLKRGRGL